MRYVLPFFLSVSLTLMVACAPPISKSSLVLITPTISPNSVKVTAIPITKTSHPALIADTPTSLPKSVSMPTLPVAQAKAKIIELIKTNNGCNLPCWWGITPGHTSINDARSFLEPLSSQSNVDLSSGSFYFPFDDTRLMDLNVTFDINNNLISEISVWDFDTTSYHLAKFLSVNGKPEQIWLSTNSEVSYGTGNIVPFLLYLYYENSRMIVAYGIGQGQVEGDFINGCITDSPSLHMWASEKVLSFLEAGHLVRLISSGNTYRNIDDATQGKLNADTFYQKFKNPNFDACFSTPKSLWPVGP